MDRIKINKLILKCIIGTLPEERTVKQPVIINISMLLDLSKAGKSDNLSDTINYQEIKDEIEHMVTNSNFMLIERLAEKIAKICLKKHMVKFTSVTVEKPNALTNTESVSVTLNRKRKESLEQ